MSENKILVEYESLFRARSVDTADLRRASLVDEIRKDVSGECSANLDEKIERWIDVTRALRWKDAGSVRCYVQAKMLYRDAFYEATIMTVRSVCELVCYELLSNVSHPFGTTEEIERVNFRKLLRHLHVSRQIPDRSFDLLNLLYDIGNRYVHPKKSQDSKNDARQSLLFLGEALWTIYGCADLFAGAILENAYS